MNLEELLKSNKVPKKDGITDEDLAKLFMKYKGLLKQAERDKAFSAATHENIKIAYAKLDELVEARTAELRKTNEQLQQDISLRKRAEEELKKRMKELEGMNKVMVGREVKMIDVEKEVNALLNELGRKPKYKEL